MVPVDDCSVWVFAQHPCILANGRDVLSISSFRIDYKGEQEDREGNWKEDSERLMSF